MQSPVPEASSGKRAAAADRLRSFIEDEMTMSHVYQPVMLRTMLEGGGAATKRQIAAAFLASDLSQLEYYEAVVGRYPGPVLRKRGIIDHDGGVYRLSKDLRRLSEWERAELIALCDGKVADYVAKRQSAIWAHRSANFDPLPGTIRYKVITRAMGRCEACGVSSQLERLEVDHIVPRAENGSNELHNLQALCGPCNVQKLHRDQTDFHAAHEALAYQHAGCSICEQMSASEHPLAAAVQVGEATAIAPRRHGANWGELWQPELNALRSVETNAALGGSRMIAEMTGARDGDPGHLVLSFAK